MKLRTISNLAVALVLTLIALASRTLAADKKADILWDSYGVPHIFAADRESMFYAHGWAQMQNQANLLLRLYGESRGRAAAYWGASNLELDRWIQLNGVPDRAKAWYDAQDSTFRGYLDAFAQGINDFAKAHPEAIDADKRVVLPVSAIDVVGHPLRAVHYGYMASRERMQHEVDALKHGVGALAETVDPDRDSFSAGSNTWTIGPVHSASGHAMLLINPH